MGQAHILEYYSALKKKKGGGGLPCGSVKTPKFPKQELQVRAQVEELRCQASSS